MNWNMRDCNLHGGRIIAGLPDDPTYIYGSGAVAWTNNLFDNVCIYLRPTYVSDGTINCDLSFKACNNLFRNSVWLLLQPIPTWAGNWVFEDNLFDKVNFFQDTTMPLDYDYNAYWPLSQSELIWLEGAAQLQPTTTDDGFTDGGNEQVLTNAPPYQYGPLGNYYLPDTTMLYGAGSTNAAALGLYHYTTRLDQTKEGDEASGHMVNIGLHYIAVNNYGQPLDTDGDGIPDYVENWHGDGRYDLHTDTETDWQNQYTTPGISGIQPIPFTMTLTFPVMDWLVVSKKPWA